MANPNHFLLLRTINGSHSPLPLDHVSRLLPLTVCHTNTLWGPLTSCIFPSQSAPSVLQLGHLVQPSNSSQMSPFLGTRGSGHPLHYWVGNELTAPPGAVIIHTHLSAKGGDSWLTLLAEQFLTQYLVWLLLKESEHAGHICLPASPQQQPWSRLAWASSGLMSAAG